MNGLKSSSAIFVGRPHWWRRSAGPTTTTERLERTLVGTGDGLAATAVVEERVDGFLEHPPLVADDDLGSVELDQALQPVIAVDDAAVEVVEVRCREAAAVEGDERAEIRRQ